MTLNRFVQCTSGIDGEKVNQWVERTLCFFETRPGCPACPNSQFEVVYQIRLVDQVVACPRWDDKKSYLENQDPLDYFFVQRDTCLTQKPFPFCSECPNSNPSLLPRSSFYWLETERRERQIEMELDDEEL